MAFVSDALNRIRLNDGAVINYVREGSGPVLIFSHGVLGDWRSWGPQWDFFTQYFDCIAWSCRFSHPNGNNMEAPDHSALSDASDLIEIMDTLEITEAILVGSSYGGFAALGAAVQAPDRVKAVVAVEPPMMKYAEMFEDTAPVAAEFRESSVLPARRAYESGDDDLGASLLNRAPVPPSPEKLARRQQNKMAGRRVAMSTDEFPLISPDALAALPMPVILFTGQNTPPIFKAIFAGVTRWMPQARVEVVEGASHSVAADRADIFNTLVLDFLIENACR